MEIPTLDYRPLAGRGRSRGWVEDNIGVENSGGRGARIGRENKSD